jgi:hypothetical protein
MLFYTSASIKWLQRLQFTKPNFHLSLGHNGSPYREICDTCNKYIFLFHTTTAMDVHTAFPSEHAHTAQLEECAVTLSMRYGRTLTDAVAVPETGILPNLVRGSAGQVSSRFQPGNKGVYPKCTTCAMGRKTVPIQPYAGAVRSTQQIVNLLDRRRIDIVGCKIIGRPE